MTAAGCALTGRRVLLTRASDRAAGLAAKLREQGARVDTRPTIALVPPGDDREAREAVRGLKDFDWLVFTSANGVRFFEALCRELEEGGAEDHPRIAAIGPATAREAEAAGYRIDLVAEESTAEGLAAALGREISPGAVVLVVRPEIARPVLPDALRTIGARPRPVAFYRNRPADDVKEIAADVRADRYDVVMLSSPSSLERLLEAEPLQREALLRALGRTRLVAIGPVTARAVERHGLTCAAVAPRPTDDAVLGCVVELF